MKASLFIDGTGRPAADGRTFAVEDPGTEQSSGAGCRRHYRGRAGRHSCGRPGAAGLERSRPVGGLRLAERFDAAMVGLNRGLVSDPAASFGGMKESGIGREGGQDGLVEFMENRYVAVEW